jgi:two-component system cell cycle response regulator
MVLMEFARRISRHMRNFDLVARIGGEEFLVILPDIDLAMAGTIAERLCAVIADEPIVCTPNGTAVTVSTSIGVTLAGETSEPVDAVLKRADTALYRAKNAGRNRVEIELISNEVPSNQTA